MQHQMSAELILFSFAKVWTKIQVTNGLSATAKHHTDN